MQQVDARQPVEEVGVGAGRAIVERRADLGRAGAAASRSRPCARAPSASRETSIASVVLPVPTSPKNHSPRPASSCSSTLADVAPHRSRPAAPACRDRRAVEGDAAVLARDDAPTALARGAPATDLRAAAAVAHAARLPRRRSSRSRRRRHRARARAGAQCRASRSWLRKRGYSCWKVSVTSPRPPLRCLAMMISRVPGSLGLLALVVLVAVDEHHEVGVLLDLARLAQVGEHRPLVGLRSSTARESCESAITGTSSSRARIFRPRLISPTCWTRLSIARVGAHQLQVVDDDQARGRRGRRAAGAGGAPWRGCRACRCPRSRRRRAAPRRSRRRRRSTRFHLLVAHAALAQVVALDRRPARR